MKGRKRQYDRPVYKNIAIESWAVDVIEECKKFGIKPNDIVIAGLISVLKSGKKMPLSILQSFVNAVQPKVDDLTESVDYFKKLIQTLESLPEPAQQQELIQMPARGPKWFDDFHAVKFSETGDYLLIEKSAYQKQPTLFELQDDNLDLDWKKLPKYYAIEAVLKVHSQNGSQKGDVSA